MGLEIGTFISDLVTTNPADSDAESQGAAHLRLIKTILQNTFPGAGRAFPIATTVVKSANYTVVKADFNTTFLLNTGGGTFTLTLPTLVAGDAGWEISILKTTTDTNAVFVAPAAGTIQSGEVAGLSKCRRCIPGLRTKVFWTGTAWIAERGPKVPVGSVIEFQGSALPVGYELPNGQTLTSASTNYPEYNSVNGSGVTPDRRGRVAAMQDSGGSGRITVAGGNFDGTGLNNAGASQSHTLAQAELPNVNFNNSGITLNDPGHQHTVFGRALQVTGGPPNQVVLENSSDNNNAPTSVVTTGITISSQGHAASGGIGTPFSNLQPTIMMNFILVTE